MSGKVMRPEERTDEALSYIRWGAESSAYAVELRLDLVSTITLALADAKPLDIEIGGVLIGSVVKGPTPTLRVDQVEMIPRRPEDGAIFMLGPDYQKRFPEVRAAAKASHKVAVGFFRSHCRSGPLRPSLADRTLLEEEFKNTAYAFLLIEASEPYRAAFYIAESGELPKERSVREFRFDEAEFRALPEIEVDERSTPRAAAASGAQGERSWYIWVAGAAGLVLAIALWLEGGRMGISNWLQPGSKELDLSLGTRQDVLKISWNHDARQIGPASNATLTITDGASRREIRLGADELKLGNVYYDSSGRPVQVTITINNPETAPITRSVSSPAR
jgi:hypothetical protein